MARRKALTPTFEVKAYISQANYTKLSLLCFSTELGKPIHGEQSRIINEALEAFFQRKDTECSPQKLTPASISSGR